MSTDLRMPKPALRPLRGYVERITERADSEARAVGLTVEKLPRGRRRYRDPRLNSHAGSTVTTEPMPTASTRNSTSTSWSAPTLTTSSAAGGGWAR